jgi:hypothetical protein
MYKGLSTVSLGPFTRVAVLFPSLHILIQQYETQDGINADENIHIGVIQYFAPV